MSEEQEEQVLSDEEVEELIDTIIKAKNRSVHRAIISEGPIDVEEIDYGPFKR
jgi:hypothetical protein